MLILYALNVFCAMFTCRPSYYQHQQNQRLGQSSVKSSINSASSDTIGFRNNYIMPISSPLITSAGNLPQIEDNLVKTVEEPYPVVWTRDGGLRGFTMKTLNGREIHAFQSIPFAQPPVGPLRFKAPVKNGPWKGIRDSYAESPTCLQTDFMQLFKITGVEDCLYLNVYTPKAKTNQRKQKLYPVLVFIHPGGYFFGSSNQFGPSYLAGNEDLVIRSLIISVEVDRVLESVKTDASTVTMNYRLGSLGFLSTGDLAAPGNNGLKDQAMALKWIYDNISAFNGDRTRITISGQSAGASSVNFHILSPMSRGLFHRGIMQSGCATCSWSITENPKENAVKLGQILNCSTEDSNLLLECLRQIDGNTLMQAQLGFLKWIMFPIVTFGPVVEPSHSGAFLNDKPENIYARGSFSKVPLISGFTSDEGSLNIATVLTNPTGELDLNGNWTELGPMFLDLENSSPDPLATATRIREFYMQQDPINFDTRLKAVQMFGDRYVYKCQLDSMELHAKYSDAPVYSYYFTYRGAYSVLQLLGQDPAQWGVSHIDDLIYLMNSTSWYSQIKLSDTEYGMSKIVTRLWASFAATGKPELPGLTWSPNTKVNLTNLGFLDLNLTPEMISKTPLEGRMKFWDSLGIENGAFGPENEL